MPWPFFLHLLVKRSCFSQGSCMFCIDSCWSFHLQVVERGCSLPSLPFPFTHSRFLSSCHRSWRSSDRRVLSFLLESTLTAVACLTAVYETDSEITVTLLSLELAPQTVATENASGTEPDGAENLEAAGPETKEQLFIDVRIPCICREARTA